MTCIAAVVYSGKVYMGGDSAAADEDNRFVSVRKEPKVFIKNEYIIALFFKKRNKTILFNKNNTIGRDNH